MQMVLVTRQRWLPCPYVVKPFNNLFGNQNGNDLRAWYVVFGMWGLPIIVIMIRKYHNHELQTNLWHREEESHNNQEHQEDKLSEATRLSLPHQDYC